MIHEEDDYKKALGELRGLVKEAVQFDVIDGYNAPIYEATLIQVLNEAEKKRQKLIALAADYREKAVSAESKAHGFAAMGSVLDAVVRGFVAQGKKAVKEEEDRKLDEAEREEEAVIPEDPKPKGRRKSS